jgi:hypothetical protein
MALIYRNVVGPIKDAQGNLMSTGKVTARLKSPVDDVGTFVFTQKVEAVVSNGAFTLPLGAPGTYDFSITDAFDVSFDQFTAALPSSPTSDITLAELFASAL